MYSVVLMAALTTGTETPDCWFHKSSGHCPSTACGCYGGVSPYSCYGCYGSCTSFSAYSCYGCYGCCGSSYSSYSCHGCYGCYGCYGCGGYAPGYAPTMIVPPGPDMPAPGKDALPAPTKEKGGEVAIPTRARLIVELPADAKLYIDDHLMTTTSGRRTFNTPVLAAGQTYYYEIRAEVVRDGKPVVEERKIVVKAGREIRADFVDMVEVAAARERIFKEKLEQAGVDAMMTAKSR